MVISLWDAEIWLVGACIYVYQNLKHQVCADKSLVHEA
jgi:hypothetical protein